VEKEIREFVKSHGILDQERAAKILDELSPNPSKSEIADAARKLRTLVVSDLVASQDAVLFPAARVLRDVQVFEEQPLSVEEFRSMPQADKQGLTLRKGRDGLDHVYKKETDIDGLVVEEPAAGTKAKILRMEQQKAGTTDTPSSALAQNAKALKVIDAAIGGQKTVRLELEDGVDISEQLDLASADQAQKVTVGPAGKGFDESLEITAADLERLMKELVMDAKKPGSK